MREVCVIGLSVVDFRQSEFDSNEGCTSGCEEVNFVTVFEVEFLKGIPVSKIRACGF